MRKVCKEIILIPAVALLLLIFMSAYAATLAEMPYGTVVSDGDSTWIVRKAGAMTQLIRQKDLGDLPYDAPEPTHTGYAEIGDTNFDVSNLRQWLNAVGMDWYTPQTVYDTPPVYVNIAGYKGTLPDGFQRAIIGGIEIPDYETTQTWLPFNGSFSTAAGSTLCQPRTKTTQMNLGRTQFNIVGWVYVMFHAMTWCQSYFPDGMQEYYNGRAYTVTHNYNYMSQTPIPAGYEYYMSGGSPVWISDRGATYHYPAGMSSTGCLEYAHRVGYGLTTPLYDTVPITVNIFVKNSYVQFINGHVGSWLVSGYKPCDGAAVFPVLTVDGTKVEIGPSNVMNFNQPPTDPASVTTSGKTYSQGAACTATVAEGVTDADGDAITYVFELSSDAGVTWSSIGASTERTITYTVPSGIEAYKIRVQAKDVNGATSAYAVTDSITIILNTPPTAPVSVELTGITGVADCLCHVLIPEPSTDFDEDAISYVFEICKNESGVWAIMNDGVERDIAYTVPGDGSTSYQIRARAVDAGDRASANVATAVIPIRANTAPTDATAVISDSVRVGSVAMARCEGVVDAEGDALTFTWEIADDTGNFTPLGSTTAPSIRFAVPTLGETYVVRVRVMDEYGKVSNYVLSQTYNITSNSAPSQPTEVTITGDAVGVQATALVSPCVDIDGDAVTYLWECKIDEADWLLIGDTVEPKLDYTVPVGGVYKLRAKAVDQYGAASEYTESIALTLLGGTPPGAPIINKDNGWTDDPVLEMSPLDPEDENFVGIMYKIERIE